MGLQGARVASFLESFWWRQLAVSVFLMPLMFKNRPGVQDTKATGW